MAPPVFAIWCFPLTEEAYTKVDKKVIAAVTNKKDYYEAWEKLLA